MKKQQKAVLAGVAGLAVLAIVAWSLGWFTGNDRYSDDPAVAELQRMRDEQGPPPPGEGPSEDFRERIGNLSDNQRREFFESSAPMMMRMMEQRIDAFLALSPEEQTAEMDRRIDEMQSRMAAGGGPPGPPGGFAGGAPPSPEQIDQFRRGMLDRTTPDQRAKFQLMFDRFEQRMDERGIERPGGGFF